MITGKAIPICRTAFQGESLMSSSPKSVGALSSSCSPRRKSGYGLVTMAYAGASVRDPHSTLGVSPGASKHEIKKAYRRLALKFHPDVCDGNHCTTNFQQINFAYETLLSMTTPQFGEFEDDLSDNLEGFMGVGDDSWEDWEEWMGWEGAGTRDYSDHINYAT
ncbi:hypothetical protein M758_1G253600 [Ceratodon purpureus]|uniref:J domain-containing protein n=1 Tax=Ceratodon purpureus TaxID=3225 RepID=A0A8T0JCH2_CERPU|nr:hypothetical protein KC19_1G260000 [Ceratodon purpureus]KAG0631440.1 hypothetical protein M758_1G253600 [Ceratodon purpureus]